MFLYQGKASVNHKTFKYREVIKAGLGYCCKKAGGLATSMGEDRFRVVVFRSPRKTGDAEGADEFFGFTSTIKREIGMLLQLQKNDLVR